MIRISGQDSITRSATIAGGFVPILVAQMMAAWRICQVAPLGVGDFRTWLAAREMVARRCGLEEGRAASYSIAELARLLGVTQRRARVSVARLQVACLIDWSEASIEFPERSTGEGSTTDDDLEDSIGRGAGFVFLPRRVLRFLAEGARPAMISAVLGIVLRCLSRRRGGFDGRGRVKAAWIARVFGVDLRRVQQARAELVELGWIEPEESDDQWAMNRHGRAYRIDLAWDRSASSEAPRLPPPIARQGASLPYPDLHQDPLRERIQNQEPASSRSAGASLQEAGGREEPLPPPRLADVRIEDLKDTGRLLGLHVQAIAEGVVSRSEADRLRFVGAAERTLAIGKANPPGLFAWLVRNGCWRYLTGVDEDRANVRIKAFLRGPESPRVASSSSRPSAQLALSEDARTVLRVRSALASAGFRGDPFPQVRRQDATWTRERWDLALAELEGGR